MLRVMKTVSGCSDKKNVKDKRIFNAAVAAGDSSEQQVPV